MTPASSTALSLLVLLVVASAASTPDTLRYNQVHAKGSHNSFQRNEAIEQQLVYDRIRSLEVDISTSGCAGAKTGDFPINHNGDCSRSMDWLGNFFDIIAAYNLRNPAHEVITIWMDIHVAMTTTLGNTLDTLMVAKFGSALFTPSQLMDTDLTNTATTLQEALANAGGWPLLDDLRGKIIVIITKNYDGYAPTTSSANARLAFIASPNVAAGGITTDKRFVFFNQDQGNTPTCNNVNTAGFVCRSYGNEDATAFNAAMSNKAHHVATNKCNYQGDTWSRTHSNKGFPFKPMDGTSTTGWVAQDGPFITLSVDSNDIDGTSDSFALHAKNVAAPASATTYSYVTFVANMNDLGSTLDQTPKWGKSGIMIRESTAANSRNVAILAAADDNAYACKFGSRQSYRATAGAGSTKTDPSDTGGIRCPYRYYQKLDYTYTPSTSTSTFKTYFSHNAQTWTQVGGTVTLAGWFPYHGIAASSRSTSYTAYKYHFDGLALNGVEQDYATFSTYAIGGATYTYSNFMST